MNALELLKTWPGWAKAGAETILASPAWQMSVRLGDEAGLLRFDATPLEDTINLDIALDGEAHVLSLADSTRYADLHLLWSKRNGLPSEVLLALLEKECGEMFSFLEKSTRRLLEIKGLTEAPAVDARTMAIETASGKILFALDLSPEIQTQLGRLEFLDPSHPSIRDLTRPARVDYCSLDLTEEERAALAVGDCLLVPDDFSETQKWIVDDPEDGAIHLCSSDSREITFGAFAEGTLPTIPEPSEFVLVLKNQILHAAAPSRLGIARAVRVS